MASDTSRFDIGRSLVIATARPVAIHVPDAAWIATAAPQPRKDEEVRLRHARIHGSTAIALPQEALTLLQESGLTLPNAMDRSWTASSS